MLRQGRELILPSLLTALLAGACTKEPAPAPKPAPEAPATAAAAGPSVDTADYAVTLSAPGPHRAGEEAAAAFAITARGTFHVNADYPIAFTPSGATNVRFAGDRLKLAMGEKTPCAEKAEDACAASVPLAFTPEGAGPATVAGTLAFSVCDPERCLIQKVPLAIAVTAE